MPDEETVPTISPEPEIDLSFSITLGKLAGALAKSHKNFKAVKKTSSNPFFKSKYADLAEVLDATADALSDNELAVIQSPGEFADGKLKLTTLLVHSSGEWLRSALRMPVAKPDAQGVGSAITYARRYAYSAIVNVASEQDDDGNAAVAHDFKRKEESTAEFDQRTEDQRLIAPFQVMGFVKGCKDTGKTEAQVAAYLQTLGISRIEDMPKTVFNEAIKWASSKAIPADLTAKLDESIKKVEEKKFSKLFAAAKRKSVPEADWRRAMSEIYKKNHLRDMTIGEFEGLVQWVENV
jgi:hypothetical protein